MANSDTKTESYLRVAAEGTRADLPTDNCCNTKTQNLIVGVANRIMDVEDEVEELKNNPDVVDIVDSYQDLQDYDTSTLTDKDIIRVLEDSTHDNNSTFYRWNATTNEFDYIGEVSSGLTPVQTVGNSTTDVMSQNAVTNMVYPNTSTRTEILVGDGTVINAYNAVGVGLGTYIQERSVAVGCSSSASPHSVSVGFAAVTGGSSGKEGNVAVGRDSKGKGVKTSAFGRNANVTQASTGGTALGADTYVSSNNAVALGNYARATVQGQVDISTGTQTTYGYNNSNYRLLTGVYDGQSANDAVNVGQVNSVIDAINTALGTSIQHIGS